MNVSLRLLLSLVAAGTLAGCATPPAPPPQATPARIPVSAVNPIAPPAPVAPAPAPAAPVVASVQTDINTPKETPPVALPDYAKRGKRLPANGGSPGTAVMVFCRGFEVEKDAQSYFRRLQRTNRLPSAAEVAERNRTSDQNLTLQQYVERDWVLRRDSNRSAPQRCKVLGGSIDGATALVVFEADLNGKRQRGTASVTLLNGKWRVRDHGDWSPVASK